MVIKEFFFYQTNSHPAGPFNEINRRKAEKEEKKTRK